MYDICKKDEMYEHKTNAIILANAGVYASPSYDKSDSRRKQRMWTEFVKSLDWEKAIKKYSKKDSYMNMKKSLLGFGNVIMVKKGSQDKGEGEV